MPVQRFELPAGTSIVTHHLISTVPCLVLTLSLFRAGLHHHLFLHYFVPRLEEVGEIYDGYSMFVEFPAFSTEMEYSYETFKIDLKHS